MSNITTIHGGSVGRFDIRAMGRAYLAAFKASEPFRDVIETIDHHGAATQQDTNGNLIALTPSWLKDERRREYTIASALAIREAVAAIPQDRVLYTIFDVEDALEPPPEPIVRAIVAAMLSVLRAKPSEGSEIYVDALVGECMEPEGCDPFAAAAVAAAAKEIWTTKTFPPSIPEFMAPVRKYQLRLQSVLAELNFIQEAGLRAREVLQKLAPEKLPKRPPTPSDHDDSDF